MSVLVIALTCAIVVSADCRFRARFRPREGFPCSISGYIWIEIFYFESVKFNVLFY